MADPNETTPVAASPPAATEDIAPDADHAAPTMPALEGSQERKDEGPTSQDVTSSLDGEKRDGLSRPATNVTKIEENDPFALFPTLSLTMSSTKGHPLHMRRDTLASLGRPLTREETMQTIKTVRSRFTEVRSEFDENASPYILCHLSYFCRTISPN